MNKQQLLPTKHASASDWDISDSWYNISIDQFVSAPSSFKWQSPSGQRFAMSLCKHTGTTQLPQGRFVSWFRHTYATRHIYLYFRNTAAIGTSNFLNSYRVEMRNNATKWYLQEYLAGVEEREWFTDKAALAVNTWRRYRLSWWLSWGILQVRLEHEVGDEWVQDGTDITVADALFGDEDIQRCGQGATFATVNYGCFVDDAEIWEYE